MPLDRGWYFLLAPPVEEAVAIIDHGEGLGRVEVPRPVRPPGEMGRRRAPPPGAEAGARPVRHRLVERDAGHRNVDAGEVARIFAPHEEKRPGIGRLDRGAPEVGAQESGISGNRLTVGHSGLSLPLVPAKAGTQLQAPQGCRLSRFLPARERADCTALAINWKATLQSVRTSASSGRHDTHSSCPRETPGPPRRSLVTLTMSSMPLAVVTN